MSDMAEFALEHVMNAEYDRFEYRMGRMSDARAYELGVIDELGGGIQPPADVFAHSVKHKPDVQTLREIRFALGKPRLRVAAGGTRRRAAPMRTVRSQSRSNGERFLMKGIAK